MKQLILEILKPHNLILERLKWIIFILEIVQWNDYIYMVMWFLINFISTYMSEVMFESNVGYVLKNSPDSKWKIFILK